MKDMKLGPWPMVVIGAVIWFAALYAQSIGHGAAALYIAVQAIGLIILGIGVFRQIDKWDAAK